MTFLDGEIQRKDISIKEEFQNGREYYQFQGRKMLILPEQRRQQPDLKYLNWHQNNVFNG